MIFVDFRTFLVFVGETSIVKATILQRPKSFDRVDRIKRVVGQALLRGDDELWILGAPLVVVIDGIRYEVPKGFTTDGASIPKIGQWLTGWTKWGEPQRWGAIVHDWFYCDDAIAKSFADQAFRAVLAAAGANTWQREVMYLAVVIGGKKAYESDQESGPLIYE